MYDKSNDFECSIAIVSICDTKTKISWVPIAS